MLLRQYVCIYLNLHVNNCIKLYKLHRLIGHDLTKEWDLVLPTSTSLDGGRYINKCSECRQAHKNIEPESYNLSTEVINSASNAACRSSPVLNYKLWNHKKRKAIRVRVFYILT